jgi:hypothetical protein
MDENNQLRVVTLSSGGTVNVWNVDLQRMQPWSAKNPKQRDNEDEVDELNSSTEFVLMELRKSYNKAHHIIERKPKTPALFYRDENREEDFPTSPPIEPKLPTKSKQSSDYIISQRNTPVNLSVKDFLVVIWFFQLTKFVRENQILAIHQMKRYLVS